MASINFLYRSTRNQAKLHLRLLYRFNNTDFVFGVNTNYEVSKEYWSKYHKQVRPKDISIVNKQIEVNNELNKIENHILTAFKSVNPDEVNKDWLQNQMDYYYNPPTAKNELPKSIINYIDYYIDIKKTELTQSSIKKCNVNKQLLLRYQSHYNKTLLIKDFDNDFKLSFENFCFADNYAPNTIARALRFIKTICRHAKSNGLETSFQLDSITAKYTKVDSVYLTTDELEQIEQTEYNDSLENAKDWLIISCYTGQRISDFMRFSKDQIRIENGKPLLEFTQQKTGKIMTIPVHPKVTAILNKRNGNFPHVISDQKYNDYIKLVCEQAKITQLVQGSKKTETAPKSGIFRKETGLFPKCDLVTSHIGRRSFATNFYGKIPTTYLINVTGHSTETMFLTYIGKSNKDLALEIANYF